MDRKDSKILKIWEILLQKIFFLAFLGRFGILLIIAKRTPRPQSMKIYYA